MLKKRERERETDKITNQKNSIELCLWHYSRYIQYWILMLIPSLGVVFLPPFGWFLIWLSFLHSFNTICSFTRLFIDSSHVHSDFIFTLHNFDASFTYIYIQFFSLSLFSPSHFRHANSHRRQFFHSFSNARMYSLRIYHIRTVVFFSEEKEKKSTSNKR